MKTTFRAVRTAKKLHLIVGTILEVTKIGGKEIAQAIERGEAASVNGSTIWIEHRTIIDSSKSGSDVYTWDRQGDKVKARKEVITRTRDGAISRTALGFSWVTP